MSDALRAIVDECVIALTPLVHAAGDGDALLGLLATLGWTAASVPKPLSDLATAGSDLIAIVEGDDDAPMPVPQIVAYGSTSRSAIVSHPCRADNPAGQYAAQAFSQGILARFQAPHDPNDVSQGNLRYSGAVGTK